MSGFFGSLNATVHVVFATTDYQCNSKVGISDDFYCHQMGQVVCNTIFACYQQEIDIHHIQHIVENQLMSSQYPQIARAYIEYRHDRDLPAKMQLNQRN